MRSVLFQPYPAKLYVLDKELGIKKLIISEVTPKLVLPIIDYLQQVYISDSNIVKKYYTFLCPDMLFEISINVEKSLILREIPKYNWSLDRDELEEKYSIEVRREVYNTMLEYSSYLPENVVEEIMKLANTHRL